MAVRFIRSVLHIRLRAALLHQVCASCTERKPLVRSGMCAECLRAEAKRDKVEVDRMAKELNGEYKELVTVESTKDFKVRRHHGAQAFDPER